ncbi:MAG: CoA-binding protein [Nitrososphaerota archaeon]|nr:CoA-binding protein [Nitrososphaerales archaeon]MDW8045437.1 CoA-binding protein [Nitrososphaerota archaeon]
MIDDEIKSALKFKTIAIVGLSRDPSKDSYRVAEYLKANGYRIIPINPFVDEVLGEKCYKSLLEIPEDIQKMIEVVDIFRPSEDVLPIVEQAIQLRQKYGKPYFIWMQLGIVNNEAAELAKKAGLKVIMDKCMMIEHKRLKYSHS